MNEAEANEADPDSGPVPRPASGSLRVLVAEDSEFNAQLMERLLAKRGYSVRLVNNGRDALALASTAGFDLLLLDVHMPEMDGFQVIRSIREQERTTGGHLPVIALTARSRNEDRKQCLAAGMDDFLAKPIRAADIWTAIDRVVGTSGTAAAAPTESTGHLIDPQVLLAACGGDADTLGKICETLRAKLPDHLAAVQQAFRDKDASRLREAAHKLFGMIAAFSTAAGAVVSDLEDHAARGELNETAALIDRLDLMASELALAVGTLSIEHLRQMAATASA